MTATWTKLFEGLGLFVLASSSPSEQIHAQKSEMRAPKTVAYTAVSEKLSPDLARFKLHASRSKVQTANLGVDTPRDVVRSPYCVVPEVLRKHYVLGGAESDVAIKELQIRTDSTEFLKLERDILSSSASAAAAKSVGFSELRQDRLWLSSPPSTPLSLLPCQSSLTQPFPSLLHQHMSQVGSHVSVNVELTVVCHHLT